MKNGTGTKIQIYNVSLIFQILHLFMERASFFLVIKSTFIPIFNFVEVMGFHFFKKRILFSRKFPVLLYKVGFQVEIKSVKIIIKAGKSVIEKSTF